MYEDLKKEILSVKMPGFHQIGEPLNERNERYVMESLLKVPYSYKRFIIEFNFVRLFRYGRRNWRIRIWSEPAPYEDERFGNFELLGRYYAHFHGTICFKESEIDSEKEIPVYEWYNSGPQKAADSFEEWIRKRFLARKRKYNKSEWKHATREPEPFNESEFRILEARKHILWNLEKGENGKLFFHVTNESETVIPYLTLDVNWKNTTPFTEIVLDIRDLQPNASKTISIVPSWGKRTDYDVTDTDPPQPEDREYFAEFRT